MSGFSRVGCCLVSVSVCLLVLCTGAFGGVARVLVSLCLVLCVFMMSLVVLVCLSMGAFDGVGMVLSLCVWCYARIMDDKTYSLSQF